VIASPEVNNTGQDAVSGGRPEDMAWLTPHHTSMAAARLHRQFPKPRQALCRSLLVGRGQNRARDHANNLTAIAYRCPDLCPGPVSFTSAATTTGN